MVTKLPELSEEVAMIVVKYLSKSVKDIHNVAIVLPCSLVSERYKALLGRIKRFEELFAQSRWYLIEEEDYQEGLQLYIEEEGNEKKRNIIENIIKQIVSERREDWEVCNDELSWLHELSD
jgi:hypothetical protein